jgi:hypothetical protein
MDVNLVIFLIAFQEGVFYLAFSNDPISKQQLFPLIPKENIFCNMDVNLAIFLIDFQEDVFYLAFSNDPISKQLYWP